MKENGKPTIGPYSAELYHYALKHANKDFKYIRKEMVNGKMRYYYEDNKGRNPKSAQLTNKDDHTKLVSNVSKLRNPATDKSRLLNKDNNARASNNREETKKTIDTYEPKVRHLSFVGPVLKKEKRIDNSPIKTLEDLPKQQTSLSIDQQQNRVNPYYDPEKPEYSMNCGYCVATMDLRRRGYDVEARQADVSSNYNATTGEIASWYKNTTSMDWVTEYEVLNMSEATLDLLTFGLITPSKDKKADALRNRMSEEGNGSYGCLYANWSNGGGHFVEWSVTNGEVYIRDVQTNKTFIFDQWYDAYKECTEYISYLRTDNREISDKILKTCRRRIDQFTSYDYKKSK